MSLLNEMLHDLAKQKQVKQPIPLFIPVSRQSRRKSRKVFFLLCLLALFVVSYGFLFSNYLNKINHKSVQNAPKEQLVLDTTRQQEPVYETPPVITLPNPIARVSYIEPIDSPASQRVELQLPVAVVEPLNHWADNQDELSSIVVNKVYTAPTLEEWHDAQLNKALQAIDRGADEQAIALLQEILVKVPNASDVRENLASLYLAYGDFAHAEEVVNEGLKYSPADVALITIKGRVFLDQGKAAAAITLLSKYRPPAMSYPDFYATLAAALQSEGRILEAGSLYRSLIQIDPGDGRYWLGYAIALEHNNKLNQAIDAYNRASQNPESEPAIRDYAENRLKILQG